MNQRVDTKRVGIFLAFAFGIAWATALVIFFTGGLTNSPQLMPGLNLALVLLATTFMWAPALANIITRLLTRQGMSNAGLRPYFRTGWPYWVAAWVLPAVVTIAGGALYFLLFPQHFAGLDNIQAQLQSAGQRVPDNLWLFVVGQVLLAILVSPPVNGLFTFGEEFGWRGYLLPMLMPLGARRAVLVLGVIWGIWHWPVIMMGYEYGFDYPGFPWIGMLLFPLFTVCAGVLLAWVTFHGRSVWPAVIGHAAINGIGGLSLLFVQGKPLALLGPAPIGVIGMAGYLALALVVFIVPMALIPRAPSSLPYPPKDSRAGQADAAGRAAHTTLPAAS